MLHEKPGFRCTWFANQTPVVAMAEAAIGRDDILVVPEIYMGNLAGIAPGVPKVIFNQNAYLTFRGWPMEGFAGAHPYQHPDVIATVAVYSVEKCT